MSYLLVIMGMEESLPWNENEDYSMFVEEIEQVVTKAVRDGAHIMIFAEQATKPIRDRLTGYQNHTKISLSPRDSHLNILTELVKLELSVEHVLLVGVNADEEILEFVKGALKFEEFPLVRIGPIQTFNEGSFCWAIEKLERLENRHSEKLQISGDPYLLYESYKELEDEESN
jgi:hypothetical protein